MLHIIDDEEVIRDSLSWLARSRKIPATGYASSEQFLSTLENQFSFDRDGD